MLTRDNHVVGVMVVVKVTNPLLGCTVFRQPSQLGHKLYDCFTVFLRAAVKVEPLYGHGRWWRMVLRHQLAKRLVHRLGRCDQITNQLVGSRPADTQQDGSLFASVVHIVCCKVVLQSFTVRYPILIAVIILADGSCVAMARSLTLVANCSNCTTMYLSILFKTRTSAKRHPKMKTLTYIQKDVT